MCLCLVRLAVQVPRVMATSFAWPSVLVKRDNTIIKPRTVVKCAWDQTFEGFLQELDVINKTVERVEISRKESFTDPVHIVPLDAPVTLCKQFDCSLCVFILLRLMQS